MTLANETKKAELRAVLKASLAKDGALEDEDEDEDSDEDESSHDQHLKQHYSLTNVGKIEVEDGAGTRWKCIGTPRSSEPFGPSATEGQDPRPLEAEQTSLKRTWETTWTRPLEGNMQRAPESPKGPRTTAQKSTELARPRPPEKGVIPVPRKPGQQSRSPPDQ